MTIALPSTRPPSPFALGRAALLLTLAALPGCARGGLRLDVSPSQGPPLRAGIGPVSIVGSMSARGLGIDLTRGSTSGQPHAPASASATRVLATAERYLGARYRYGGESPTEGFDCSGFVQYVFGRHGVELPRTSYQQATTGRAVSGEIAALRPGDLMFFSTGGGRVDHVAIYAGDGRVIHATSGAGVVRYDDLDTDRGEWLLERFVRSRRVLAGARRVDADELLSLTFTR